MKKLSTLLFFLSPLILLSFTGSANNNAEFEKWLQQEKTVFQEYKDARDKEFSGFLKSQWLEMQTMQGLVRDKTPKPTQIPEAPKPQVNPLSKTPETNSPITPVIVNIPVIKPVSKPVPIKPAPLIEQPSGTKIHLTFYGQSLTFYYDAKLKVHLQSPINESAISHIWSEMSQAKYDDLLKQIEAQRKPLNLNDWGYALLTHEIAKKIHTNRNDQFLFVWYFMSKTGYQARIAFDQLSVYLLMPSQQQLFGAPYFTFNNIRYYALSFDGTKQKPNKIFTYNGNYPGAKKSLDMSLSHAFNTGRQQKERVVNFTYKGKTYNINIAYDAQTIRYLKTYPQMDITLYFNSKFNQATANPILAQLKPLVTGKSEEEAINLILRFVQTAFKYKTDEQQFGIENYFFPEETLFYPYSDCEDRAVFFAWIVHNLLGLQIVGLDYPGHIATAVKFSKRVNGDAININGKRFVITDPTYINANAGMTMPAYKNIQPTVIQIFN
ncbi:hypothetical protein MNBD_GAMMA08-1675 [hydrothermal vent metagenome]|uniref:Transglutaminase-like domain-containing protein n=1 Tax=hydrothermal vent metagenome TaxID=652676 RepID=A0A3B0YC67_9ZZZZ